MKGRRVLLLLVLLYVGLDLCLADMPGAFVFDPADSVESVEASRGRLTSKVVFLPAPARETFLVSLESQTEPRHRLETPYQFPLAWRVPLNYLPRATAGSPSSSEDPH